MSHFGAILRHERLIVGLALICIVTLAGWYIWRGAGMGMPARDMTAAVLFPHRLTVPPGDMAITWPLALAMWWVMMIAMMTPGVTPLMLLYERVLAHHHVQNWRIAAATALLLSGYLLIWLVFSVGATALQFLLQPSGLLSGMMLWSRSAVLSAALLAMAGLYQWSPWKRQCLKQCQEPARFIAEHARTGLPDALVLGLRHGLYCLGCCGPLMLLLFVGGIMNVIWIAALSVLVLCEKLLPASGLTTRLTGSLLIAWAIASLVV